MDDEVVALYPVAVVAELFVVSAAAVSRFAGAHAANAAKRSTERVVFKAMPPS